MRISGNDTTLLTLEVVDFKDEKHWVWRLKDSVGRVLGTHAVNLERKMTQPEGAAKPPEATGEATDPEYWGRHLCQPVRFSAGLGALFAAPDRWDE